MNEAHWHLALNHFPIIGNILGLVILILSIFWKTAGLKKAGYILLILAGISAIPANMTGEKAEHKLENLGIPKAHDYIEEHEELAEKGLFICLTIGVLSLAALILETKKPGIEKILFYAILIFSIGNVWLMKEVGTSGGEIRHTEIREGASQISSETQNQEED